MFTDMNGMGWMISMVPRDNEGFKRCFTRFTIMGLQSAGLQQFLQQVRKARIYN